MDNQSNEQPNEGEIRKRELLNLMNSLNNFKIKDEFDSIEAIEAKYGVPTMVVSYTEDGFDFEKKIWQTETGKVEMLTIQPHVNTSLLDKELKTLEYLIKDFEDDAVRALLAAAVKDEDYLSAAILRDELRARKK